MKKETGVKYKKLPRYVFVLGVPFRLELTPNLKDTDGVPLFGLTRGDKRSIEIDSDLTIRQQYETLIHEVMHAVLHVGGGTHLLSTDSDVEETLIRQLEVGIVSLIEQLPQMSSVIQIEEKTND